MSETVRGGINSIDVGQIEGAKALGMGYVPMMIYIILPQTFKIIAPQIGNTFVANIKDTSVLNVIAVTELFYIQKLQPELISECLRHIRSRIDLPDTYLII